jgi:hypothetical protein
MSAIDDDPAHVHAAQLALMRQLGSTLEQLLKESPRLCLDITADARHATDAAMKRAFMFPKKP